MFPILRENSRRGGGGVVDGWGPLGRPRRCFPRKVLWYILSLSIQAIKGVVNLRTMSSNSRT